MRSLDVLFVRGAATLLIALLGHSGSLTWGDEAAGDSSNADFVKESTRPAPSQRTLSPQDSRRVAELQPKVARARLQGKFDEALKAAEEILSVRSAALGDDHWLTGHSSREAALLRQIAGMPAAAQAELAKADQLHGEAERLHAQRRLGDAIERIRQVIRLRADHLGQDHLEVVLSRYSLATCLRDAKQYAEAELVYQIVLETRRQQLGAGHPDTAFVEIALARNLRQWGKLDQAELLISHAYATYRKVFGNDHPQTAIAARNLIAVLSMQGHFDRAEPVLRESLATMRRKFGEEHAETARAYIGLADNLLVQGRVSEAETSAERALRICLWLHGRRHPDTTATMEVMARILATRGELARAETLLRHALEIDRQVLPPDHPRLAVEMAWLAYYLHNQAKFAEADPLFREAVALGRRVRGPTDPVTLSHINAMALNLTALRRFSEARPLLERSLEQLRESLGDDHPLTAMAHNNLGCHLQKQEEFAAAADTFRAAMKVSQRRFGDDHPRTVGFRGNLAVALLQMGRFAEAEVHCRGVLEIRRRLLGEHHWLTAMAYRELGRCLACQQRFDEAEGMLVAAADGFGVARGAVSFEGLGRAEFGAVESPLEELAALLARRDRPQQAWRRLEESLARGLWDDVSIRASRRLSDDDRAKEQSLLAQLRRLDEGISTLTSASEPTEQQRQRLAQLRGEREATRVSYSNLQREFVESYGVAGGEQYDLGRIQAALAPNEALVAWLDVDAYGSVAGAPAEHWACVLRSQGSPRWIRLPGTGPSGKWTPEDDERPRKLFAALLERSNRSSAWQTLADEVRRQRLAPLEPHLDAAEGLPAVRHLLVLPSRALAGIPIEVIAPGRVVSYVPSGTMHAWGRSRPARESDEGQTLLALGDPQFQRAETQPAENLRASQRRPGRGVGEAYPPLPASRVEVESIARLFPRPRCLLGSEANEQKLQALADAGELKSFSHLHFATHGELNVQAAMQSALILSRNEQPEESLESLLNDQDVFDGRLTAQQVLRTWKLDADLVTLSACQSGLGKPTAGEGYLGFSQAMLLAGARSLVVSLWKVDDVATALLMERFYQNLLGQRRELSEPMPKAAALDEAKRWLRALRVDEVETLLKRFPATAGLGDIAVRGQVRSGRPVESVSTSRPFEHPFYWAAFVLIGEGN